MPSDPGPGYVLIASEQEIYVAREPILNVPAIVLAVLALLVAVHGGLALLSEQSDEYLVWALAFIPARYIGFADQIPGGPIAAWTSFVTHQFVHGDMTHLLINSAWLLVFGSAVAKRIGAVRFAVFGLLCGIAGAALFGMIRWGEAVPMVGASGAISGLMAAGFRLLLPAIDNGDFDEMREEPRSVPLATLAECLRSRRVMFAVAAFVVVNFAIAFAAPMLACCICGQPRRC